MKWLLWWLGGSIGRVAAVGLIAGGLMVIAGVVPGLFADLPLWATQSLLRLALLLIGLIVIGASLVFNVWWRRQIAIDELAEDLSSGIRDLLNRTVTDTDGVKAWEKDFKEWCARVSTKLENRAFFTRADQLHFDRLGMVPPATFAASFDGRHAWLVSQLSIKFDRLRDIINWTQMRKR